MNTFSIPLADPHGDLLALRSDIIAALTLGDAGARLGTPLPVTERLAGEILTLPLFPSLTGQQVDRVINSVRRYFTGGSAC